MKVQVSFGALLFLLFLALKLCGVIAATAIKHFLAEIGDDYSGKGSGELNAESQMTARQYIAYLLTIGPHASFADIIREHQLTFHTKSEVDPVIPELPV